VSTGDDSSGNPAAPQHLAEFTLRVLRHVLQGRALPGRRAATWHALRGPCAPGSALASTPHLWREALKLLQLVSLPVLASDDSSEAPPSAEAGVEPDQALRFWVGVARHAGPLAVRTFAVQWLQTAAEQCAPDQAGGHASASPAEPAAEDVAAGNILERLGLNATPSPKEARAGICSAVLQTLLSLADDAAPDVRIAAAQSLHAVLQALSTSTPVTTADVTSTAATDQLRKSASEPSSSSSGWPVPAEQLAALGQAACERLSDVDDSVASAWARILGDLEPHLARLATGIGTSADGPPPRSLTDVR
jgi:hypothetical protein